MSFQAPSFPGLVRLSVTVSQRDVSCSAEALITVTESLDGAVGLLSSMRAAYRATRLNGPLGNCGARDSMPSGT